jgi:hypothetical protein
MRKTRFLLGSLVFVLVSLACNFPGSTGVNRPPTPFPLTTEEVQQVEEEIVETLSNPDPSGAVTVTITEQQINAFLTNQDDIDTDQMIQDPQVQFTDGKVIVFGKVNQGGFTMDTKVTMNPRVEAGGRPKLEVESVNVGPMALPDSMVKQVDQRVDALLENYLASTGDDFTVQNIIVTEGMMTITGVRQ